MRLVAGFLFCVSCLITSVLWGQKTIQGVFTYNATINFPQSDSVYKSWKMVVFTNDTIVRVETETDYFGNQVYIRHMSLKKAYLLIEANGQKYAIQTDLVKQDSLTPKKPSYNVQKKTGGKKIAGIRCKRYYIYETDLKIGYDAYFAKKVSNKYLEFFTDVPGLGLDFYRPSEMGLVHYQLESFVSGAQNRDLFGIPSDYKRVTFDQFMSELNPQ